MSGMPISAMSRLIKAISRKLPRRHAALQSSMKQSTLNFIEMVWNLKKHKKPIFRRGLTVESHCPGGVSCEWLYRDPGQKGKIVFYLHGGAYLAGDLPAARNRSMRYALKTSASLFVVDYRVSAAAPFPAALEDAETAYSYIKELAPGAEIIFIGDSAGGGLALALAERLRDQGRPLPQKIILNSPWTDLTCSFPSYEEQREKDVVLTEGFLKECARLYAGGRVREASDRKKFRWDQDQPFDQQVLKEPYLSPVFGDFTGFPPVWIHVGTDEILLDDSRKLAENLQRDGAPVTLAVWPGMYHMFHYFEALAPESAAVCREIYRVIESPPSTSEEEGKLYS